MAKAVLRVCSEETKTARQSLEMYRDSRSQGATPPLHLYHVHVLSEGLVGLALKLHVALGGIAHRPLESLYSTQTFRLGPS